MHKIDKGEGRHIAWLPLLSLPRGATLNMLPSPAVKMLPQVCNVSAQGSLFETPRAGFLLAADHVGILSLATTKMSDSQKESEGST